MTELEKKAIDVIRNHSHKLIDNFTQEDLENREISIFLAGYHEANKANEWHYVNWKYFADIDYPKSESALYLVQLRNKDTLICEWETEEGFGYFYDSNLEPIDNDDVYAWKEIVLPKESK